MKEPEIATPSEIFSQSARYKAPAFQRYYVWGRKEWDGLVEDLETASGRSGQFLGAIVLKDLGKHSGPMSPTTYLLVDGQQRLTTLYLLLLALAAEARNNGHQGECEYIVEQYLAEKNRSFLGWPKLVPTLQDRHTFYEILRHALPDVAWDTRHDPVEGKPRASAPLVDQWKRICTTVAQKTGSDVGKFKKIQLDSILSIVQTQLKIINITLENNDDANGIFNRLNAKGVALELADLVRNEVFSKFVPVNAKDAAKAELFFSKNWIPFEKMFPDGTLDAFFPIYGHIALKGRATKAAAFGELQQLWRKASPATIISGMAEYAPFYAALSRFDGDIPSLSSAINQQVERISRMPKTRVTWPFLIQVLHSVSVEKLSQRSALKCLKIVESFLVRRALFGEEPTGLHAVFKVLWEKTKGDPKVVLDKIFTRTITSPSDSDLIAHLKKEPSDTRAILPYVLQEWERHLILTNKYDPPTITRATLEHIMPRNLGKGWVKSVTAQDHHRVHRLIGNMAALSEGQNKSLKDQAWSEKRKRFKGSDFKSTRKLSAKVSWTVVDVDSRTASMSRWIVTRWPELGNI